MYAEFKSVILITSEKKKNIILYLEPIFVETRFQLEMDYISNIMIEIQKENLFVTLFY